MAVFVGLSPRAHARACALRAFQKIAFTFHRFGAKPRVQGVCALSHREDSFHRAFTYPSHQAHGTRQKALTVSEKTLSVCRKTLSTFGWM